MHNTHIIYLFPTGLGNMVENPENFTLIDDLGHVIDELDTTPDNFDGFIALKNIDNIVNIIDETYLDNLGVIETINAEKRRRKKKKKVNTRSMSKMELIKYKEKRKRNNEHARVSRLRRKNNVPMKKVKIKKGRTSVPQEIKKLKILHDELLKKGEELRENIEIVKADIKNMLLKIKNR